MASPQRHRDWARRNWDFYEASSGGGFRDWSVTIAFYVSLHEVKGFLEDNRATVIAAAPRFPETHREIRAVLRVNSDWRGLGTIYNRLLRRSKRTRYYCWEPTPSELDDAVALMRSIAAEIARLS